MFGIGFGEVLVIAVILIIVVGPARLPALMATLGRALRTARQASDELRSSLGLRELMRMDPYEPRRTSHPRASRNGAQVETETDLRSGSEPEAAKTGDKLDNGYPIETDGPRRTDRNTAGKSATASAGVSETAAAAEQPEQPEGKKGS